MPQSTWANNPLATQGAAINTAPAAGTVETWTVIFAAGAAWPVLGAGRSCKCLIDSELVAFTSGSTAIGTQTITVTRGIEGSTITTHPTVGTTISLEETAGDLTNFVQAINLLNYGGVADGVTDNTAAINTALAALVNGGGGTLHIPQGTWRVNGQVLVPNLGSGQTYFMPNITIQGDGSGFVPYAYGTLPQGGTVLDMRFDGTASDPSINDFAVASGLSFTTTATTISVASGTAWLNNATTTTLTTIAASGAQAMTGAAAWASIDIDAAGNLYRNNTAYWTDTTQAGTTAVRLSDAATFGTSATPNTVRICLIYWTGAAITTVADERSHLGKIECRGTGYLGLRDLALTRLDNPTIDDAPFVHTTAASLRADRVLFRGSRSSTTTAFALQDAYVCGGQGSPYSPGGASSLDASSVGSPYGTVVRDCIADNCRRAIWIRGDGNEVLIDNLIVWSGCGGGSSYSPIEIQGSHASTSSACIIRNLFLEMRFYSYGVSIGAYTSAVEIGGLVLLDNYNSFLSSSMAAGATSITLPNSPPSPLLVDILNWKSQQFIIDASTSVQEVITVNNAAITGTNPSGGATTGTITGGTNSLVVSQAAGFTAGGGVGNAILIGTTTGTQETAVVNSIAGTTLTLVNNVVNTHTAEPVTIAPWTLPIPATTYAHAVGGDPTVSRSLAGTVLAANGATACTVLGGIYGSAAPAIDLAPVNTVNPHSVMANGPLVVSAKGNISTPGNISASGTISIPQLKNLNIGTANLFNDSGGGLLYIQGSVSRIVLGDTSHINHIIHKGLIPTVGTNGTNCTMTVVTASTDTSGILNLVVAGASTVAGALLGTLVWNSTYYGQPHISLTPIMDATATAAPTGDYYADQTASVLLNFALKCVAILPVGTYRIAYNVISSA